VDDEPCRLVDDHQYLIFVDDIQRNGLGDDLELMLGTAQLKGDDVEGLDAVVALDGLVADEDIPSVKRLLDATTTATRHACSQILVDAHRRLPLVSYDTEVLIERRAIGVLEIGDRGGIEALDLGGVIGEEEIFVAFPDFAIKE